MKYLIFIVLNCFDYVFNTSPTLISKKNRQLIKAHGEVVFKAIKEANNFNESKSIKIYGKAYKLKKKP